MRPCRMTALSLFVILMLPGLTLAIPHLINYQGRLTDGTGSPITTPATVEFRVYNVPTGGTELWMESQTVTPNTDGLFSIELGSAIPIPDSALSGSEAWLEIKIDTDPPIFPRTRLSAVPYARIASSLIGAGPLHLSETNLSSGDSGSVLIGVSADSGVTEITTARSSAGQATGKRQHRPFTIVKEWNATDGTASAEMKSMIHVDSGFSQIWLYSTPDATVEGHENGHSFGHGHLDYLKKVSDPSSGSTTQQETSLEPDSGVIESTTTESTTGTATGKRVHQPFRIVASNMTTTNSDTTFWSRFVDVDSGFTDSIYVSDGSQTMATRSRARSAVSNIANKARLLNGDEATFESSLRADSGYSETAGMTKSDLVTEIAKETSQTREHILLSRQVGPLATATSASIELENTNDGPQITMTKEGTAGDPNDDGVVILDASVPGGIAFTVVTYGDTATSTTASSDKRKQSLYFPGSLHSALDLLVDGTASMIILKKLNPTSGGADSNVVIDNNGDMQLAGQMTVGGSQGTVANSTTFTVPRISASQRDALTAVNGMIIYNTTTNQFNFYENGAWVIK